MANRRITQRAEELLSTSGATVLPIAVEKLAEQVGAVIRRGPLPADLSGFLVQGGGRKLIGVNSLHAKQRQRFTIAHEIGHLVLHDFQNHVDRGVAVYHRDHRSSSAEAVAEIEANQFAAELLMPKRMIDATVPKFFDLLDEQQIKKIADRFQVSSQALTFRLINLGLAQPDSAYRPVKARRS
jgi:Zn-dependent peptidase ImmA (M78 family)